MRCVPAVEVFGDEKVWPVERRGSGGLWTRVTTCFQGKIWLAKAGCLECFKGIIDRRSIAERLATCIIHESVTYPTSPLVEPRRLE